MPQGDTKELVLVFPGPNSLWLNTLSWPLTLATWMSHLPCLWCNITPEVFLSPRWNVANCPLGNPHYLSYCMSQHLWVFLFTYFLLVKLKNINYPGKINTTCNFIFLEMKDISLIHPFTHHLINWKFSNPRISQNIGCLNKSKANNKHTSIRIFFKAIFRECNSRTSTPST